MIRIIRKDACCGCGACAQVCSKKCITMIADAEGFLYPQVRTEDCVECGACERVCPILNKKKPEDGMVTAYAAYTKDAATREASSSGGVFSVLAEQILARGGVVYGAALDEDLSVCHMGAENQEELALLRGSKYIQSRIGDTYCQAKNALQSGRVVLFTGTGCQIAGLKSYLGKEYEHLYTVDVLCHGVPSPKVWRAYLDDHEKRTGVEATGASFRSKTTGWKKYGMKVSFLNGEAYEKKHGEDLYFRLFLSEICLRPSCHRCRFKDFPRVSELTIGDAWGIHTHMPDMDDDRGTSVVLVNSEKGQRLLQTVMPEMVSRQGALDVLLPVRSASRRSVRPHPNRKRFFAALDKGEDLQKLAGLMKKSVFRRFLSAGKKCLMRRIRN